MTKRLIAIDDDALTAAQAELGTTTLKTPSILHCDASPIIEDGLWNIV